MASGSPERQFPGAHQHHLPCYPYLEVLGDMDWDNSDFQTSISIPSCEVGAETYSKDVGAAALTKN
jgi:hypothetical protein